MSVQPRMFQEEAAPAEPQARDLRLLRLKFKNWKCFKDFEVVFDGQDAAVYGENGVGKTTIFDGFDWLLFGKDSHNRADFEIKPLGADGEPAHGLDCEVEGALRLGDREFVLRKVYSEKWTKQHGKADRVFTGHEVSHFVDGVPRKEQDYKAFVASIVEEGVFRLLSDPAYFNEQLRWPDRRALLLKVCGNVSDDQVFDADPKLEPLREILRKLHRTVDDHRSVLLARRAEANKELERIPVRIAEVERGLPDVSGLDEEAIGGHVADLKLDRKARAEELARAEAGGEAAEKRRRLREVEGQLLDLENRDRAARDGLLRTKRGNLENLRFNVGSAEREAATVASDLASAQAQTAKLGTRLQELHKRFEEVQSREFVHEDATICPTCGQTLPEEMVQEAHEKALEAFNLALSQELDEIDAEGRAVAEQRARAEAEIARCKKAGAEVQKRIADLKRQASAAQTELEKFQNSGRPVSESPEYVRLANERDTLDTVIAGLEAGGREALDAIRAELAALDEAVGSAEKSLLVIGQRASGEKRIEELKRQERQMAAELEDIERQLYLRDEFTRAKVRLLEEPVNARFKHATFKLFNVLVNGTLEDCCETLYQGVPYTRNLNDGWKINVGLDILNTLSEHFGIAAPIFVDHAESVTNLIPVRGQVIQLIHSRPDKTLRIEKEVSN